MKRETFNLGFAALVNGYAYAVERVTPESQDVYWEMLKGIPDAKFNEGVRKCLSTCKFFPTIAELGDASLPPKTKLARYNPYTYSEPEKITWETQVREIEQKQRLLSECP
jgi:hypothetical protein